MVFVVEYGLMATAQTQASPTGKATRFVVRDVLFDVIRFPVWWYTTGTANAVKFVLGELQSVMDRLSIRILFRNLLKPMYGDTTRSGRIISLFMRLLVFVFRMIGLAIWSVVLLLAFVFWLAIMPLIVWQIVMQIIG